MRRCQSGYGDIVEVILPFDCSRAVCDLRRVVLVHAGIIIEHIICAALRSAACWTRDKKIRCACIEIKREARLLTNGARTVIQLVLVVLYLVSRTSLLPRFMLSGTPPSWDFKTCRCTFAKHSSGD